MNPEFEHEQPADDGGELSRRGFLRLAGYSAAALSLVGCRERPPQTALPYTVKPVDVTPGRPVWYASTCQACSAGCGLLVKCRDGRPIKLEGNPRHPLSQGRLCAAGQAAVLGVYDSLRLRGPLLRGEATTWQRLDDEVVAGLDRLRRG